MTSENPRQSSQSRRRLPRVLLPLALLLTALLLMGAGCTPPTQDDRRDEQGAAAAPTPVAVAAAGAATDAPPQSPPRQAPPMSDPLPPVRAPEREAGRSPRAAPSPAPAEVPAGAPVKISTSCTRDADCVVKNVGNCCGYYPACVNVESPTDPAAVQAQCARTGTMSVCGFKPVEGCECVQGQCRDKLMLFDSQ